MQCEDLASDGGDITGVTTASGSGLIGGAASGEVALSLASCPNGEVLKSSGTGWACGADAVGPTYTPAGSGTAGILSAADWNTFNSKRSTGGRNLIEWLPVLTQWTHLSGGAPPTITLITSAADVREGGSAFQFDRDTTGASGAVYGGMVATAASEPRDRVPTESRA